LDQPGGEFSNGWYATVRKQVEQTYLHNVRAIGTALAPFRPDGLLSPGTEHFFSQKCERAQSPATPLRIVAALPEFIMAPNAINGRQRRLLPLSESGDFPGWATSQSELAREVHLDLRQTCNQKFD
jgi:hypothetical protein